METFLGRCPIRRRLASSLLAALVLSAAMAWPQSTPTHDPVLDVGSMDQSVDPCTDFYTYSCGGWLKKNPIPPDQVSWGVYDKMADDNRLILRDILEHAAIPSPSRNAGTQKIGDYYAACMNEKSIDAAGIKPFQEKLRQIDELRSKQDIAGLAATMTYDNVLFSFGSGQDFKDSAQVIAQLDQGGLSLPDRDFYLLQDAKSITLRKAFEAHVRKMFELIGDTPHQARDDARRALRIETALAKGSMNRVERRDPQKIYHRMSPVELQALSPDFRWNTYFAKVGISEPPSLNVATPDFFKTTSAELKKENLKSWKAYLRWHLVHANAAFLSAPFVDANFAFYGKTLQGAEQIEPRWKRCVDYVDSDLGEALGQAYVERTFSPEAKQHALTVVRQIEAAMQQDIESLPWMTMSTKQHALEKLRTIVNKIGYPDHWRDYTALTISRDDEIGNVLRAREFEFHRQLAKIGKPVDRGEWVMTPPTVNAYYDSLMNDINFPAGILQPPLFDPESDDAPNYGDTGATIGHELTHGFDDEGRQFDAQGNLRDWWTPADSKEFEKRASCIADAVFPIHRSGSHQNQWQADAGRGCRRPGRIDSGLHGMAGPDERASVAANGWLHPEATILSSATGKVGAATLATKQAAHAPWPTLILRINSEPMAWFLTCRNFSRHFTANADSPMVRQNRCRVW